MNVMASTRVFVATGPVDLRKSFDTLAGVVRAQFGREPLEGHVFVFIGRERTSVKLLWWDRTGYAILHKRLAVGRFARPAGDAADVELEWPDLLLLLEGIDLAGSRRRARWRRHPSDACQA